METLAKGFKKIGEELLKEMEFSYQLKARLNLENMWRMEELLAKYGIIKNPEYRNEDKETSSVSPYILKN